MDASARSYEPIRKRDLARLSEIAEDDRKHFFIARPEYRRRVLCVALCQGAGLHYVDIANGKNHPNGVKDFDVWTFFATIRTSRFPADRRNTHCDFGKSRFGRWGKELSRFRHFEGRRVDLLMRTLPVGIDADPVRALHTWLTDGKTASARALALKGVVLIDPPKLRGRIVWPPA